MFWALAVIMLAFAGFSVLVIRRPRPAQAHDPNSRLDVEQLKGFVYVGAAVLALVSVTVITTGLLDRRQRAGRSPCCAGILRLRPLPADRRPRPST